MLMSVDVAERFYSSFAAGDAEGMLAEYAPDVVFEDPVFGELRGSDAMDMWRMLCAAATDLTIEHRIVSADDRAAEVAWTARYTFSTGRPVTNVVTAHMRFEGGRIVEHRDDFSLWRWCSQALGPTGRMLGWTPMMASKVRANARSGLRSFQRTD